MKGKAPTDLPRRYSWARDEIVRLRLENFALRERCASLAMDLALAQGRSSSEAATAAMQEAGVFEVPSTP